MQRYHADEENVIVAREMQMNAARLDTLGLLSDPLTILKWGNSKWL